MILITQPLIKDEEVDGLNWWGRQFKGAPEQCRKNKKFTLNTVRHNWQALQFASEELRKDKQVVLDAVENNIMALDYAHDDLKKDKKFMMLAEKWKDNQPECIAHLRRGEDTWDLIQVINQNSTRDEVLKAVRRDGCNLVYFGDEKLRNDKEVVMEAVKTFGYILVYVSDELQNDKDVVIEAVRHSGVALKFASDELRNDKYIVIEAVKQDINALQFASDQLKNNKEFMMLVDEVRRVKQ